MKGGVAQSVLDRMDRELSQYVELAPHHTLAELTQKLGKKPQLIRAWGRRTGVYWKDHRPKSPGEAARDPINDLAAKYLSMPWGAT